jgi:putative endopeptidase
MRTLLLTLILCSAAALADQPVLNSGVDKANIDSSIRPGQDFFQYVNGIWIKNNPIPPEYSRWGAFPQLRDRTLIALHELMADLIKRNGVDNDNRRKLRDFYRAGMDEAEIERQGARLLEPELDLIQRIEGRQELIRVLGLLRAEGHGMLFSLYVGQDEKHSSTYAAHLWQGGLGLPEKEYYLGTTEDSKKIRSAYRDHVAKMLTLLGDAPADAAKSADIVLGMETRLADASRAPAALREREAQYNKKTRAELAELTPNLDWMPYLLAVKINPAEVIVGQPEFFQRVDEMISSVAVPEWRAYLRWHLIHSAAPYLSKAFERENFHFYSEVLRGVKEMQPRWKRVLATLDQQMGEALGKLYVEKHFTPAAKERMDLLVRNLMVAYGERIESRDWMEPATKRQALAKLAAITPKIGYPSKWRDYSTLTIDPNSYLLSVLSAQAFESRRQLARLGQPVDRTEWHMTPQTVNAYYSSTMNEIVFPAGILQLPFFDPSADDAVNYGAIGAVIGHEITHGFDDQGSRADGNGNLKNWWTLKDRARFIAKTDKVAKQFDGCVAVDDLHINGKLTLGENIADLGGIAIAYAAYQHSLNEKPAPVLDGFTGAQRFFIGFAQVWRGSVRDADQRMLLRTDPHSPGRFRTLVPLSNIQAFYDAFDVQPGDAMYRAPSDRAEVW